MTDNRRTRRQYRLSSWRHDVPRSTFKTFWTEGDTLEDCDQEALIEFNKVSDEPSNSWEGMDIVRIDTPAVAEKITFLRNNGRQESRD